MDQPSVLAMLSRVVVTLPHLGGQGVLIPGGFVLTAAHSLPGKVMVGGAAPSTGWRWVPNKAWMRARGLDLWAFMRMPDGQGLCGQYR